MDCKQALRNSLDEMLGSYIPNKVDLDNLTNYIYKLTLNAIKEADNPNEELKNVSKVNELDEQGFIKSLHTIALSASSNVMYATLQKTFKDIRNKVELIKVNADNRGYNSGAYFKSQPDKSDYIINDNEGTFELDLSQGQVSEELREELNRQVETDLQNQANYYGVPVPQVNTQKPKNEDTFVSYDMEFNIPQSSNDTLESGPSLDASRITDGNKGKAPKFSGISLDY